MLRRPFVVVVLVAVLCVNVCLSACYKQGHNQVPENRVLPRFDNFTDSLFVGQVNAVKQVRNQLSAYMRNDGQPLVLHFIGPPGSGKSFLAEIIAKSLFYPMDCEPVHITNVEKGATAVAAAVGALALLSNPLLSVAALGAGWGLGTVTEKVVNDNCWDGKALHWISACGVSHKLLVLYEDSKLIDILGWYFERTALEVSFQPRTVLILDDFQFCEGERCSQYFKNILENLVIHTKEGRPVSLRDSVIIFTSDLKNLGLELAPGTSYEEALEDVRTIANSNWGKQSAVMSVPVVVPFAPLSYSELLAITEKELSAFKQRVKSCIERAIVNKNRVSADKYKWTGTLYIDTTVSTDILDRSHDETSLTTSRTITQQVRGTLDFLITNPELVENRVMAKGVVVDKDGVMVYTQCLELVVLPHGNSPWLELKVLDE